MNSTNDPSDKMNLRKRVLIIFVLLIIVFLTHLWYFYRHPSNGNLNLIETINKNQLKSSYGIARNLMHGYRMHKQSLNVRENATKINNTTDGNKFYNISKVEQGDHISTSSPRKFRRSAKLDSITKRYMPKIIFKRNVLTTDIPVISTVGDIGEDELAEVDEWTTAVEHHMETTTTTTTTTKRPIKRKKHVQNINIKNSNKLNYVKNPIKDKIKVTKNYLNQDDLKLNVDKVAFAEVDESLLYNFNDPLPLKKNISRKAGKRSSHDANTMNKNENNYKGGDSEIINQHAESNFDYNYPDKLNIIDHRLTNTKNRKDLTRQEILFGDLTPRNVSSFTDEIKIVSMSLYGSEQKYLTGAIKNAHLIKQNFPGWKLRVYVESHALKSPKYGLVPQKVLDALQDLGADLHFIEPEEDFLPPMMWRFLVADDPTVDRFIIRDSDSRLTERDYKSVEAWMASGQAFHCVRDHPSHVGYSVSGGLWGGVARKLRNVIRSSWIDMMRGLSSKYFTDMSFLQVHLWPRVVSYAYCSDSVSCDKWPNAFPFPVQRYGFDHVGQVYDEKDIGRRVDLKILQRKGENHLCYPPDEEDAP